MLDYRNKVFIAVLVFYSSTFLLSVARLIQHGLKKAASERVLGVFSIARILTSAFQLSTINNPTNTSLWAGYVTTFSISISLLLSSALLLLQRLAKRAGKQFPKIAGRDSMKTLQILVTVGLILGIVGGIETNGDWKTTGKYSPDGLLKAGIAIFVAAWAIIVALTLLTLGRANSTLLRNERLCVAAYVVALPLLLVRIVYSMVSIFANPVPFNSIYGDVTIMLCMALLEEMVVVLIFQGVGMVTLGRDERNGSLESGYGEQESMPETVGAKA